MAKQRIRIRLKAFDHKILDQSAQQIVETAERTGAVVAGPVPLPTPKAPDSPESLPECISTSRITTTARMTWMTESIVSTGLRVAECRAGKERTAGARAPELAPNRVGIPHTCVPMAAEDICQPDYESFTESWFPADMTPGGRIPRMWIRCAGHTHGTSHR